MHLHPALTYTLGRFGLVVLAGIGLYLLGFRAWALALSAVAVSLPLSWFLLRRQRDELAKWVAVRQARRREEKQKLRAALRGDTDKN